MATIFMNPEQSKTSDFYRLLLNLADKINIKKSDKYCQKPLDHAKQSASDARKTTSKKVIQKTVKATGDLNGNIIANKIIKFSKISPQNIYETVEIETERKKDISPEKRQKIIDDLRLI